MMRSLGIDLAAEPPDTAACEIIWLADGARGRLYTDRLDDDRLLALIGSADKVGIDCPFGWPQPFVNAVVAHAHGQAWPGRGQPGPGHRRSLRYRLTDEIVHQQVGIWPLSVSTDRIGVTAMRCAALLDALAAVGQPVDRTSDGRAVEVYPAAALKYWGLPHQGYACTAIMPLTPSSALWSLAPSQPTSPPRRVRAIRLNGPMSKAGSTYRAAT